MFLAFARKNPVVFTAFSSSEMLAAAILWGFGHRLNKSRVTRLTRLSVHWADKIVEMRSSKGFLNLSEQSALG
jgi:ABC-type taurine transport system substrate-binding protein